MKTTTPLAMHRSEPSPVRQASQVQVINKSFPIVGIGASAGGLEAFSQLLRNLPQKTGMAFTLVQHLDPKYGSILPETLSRVTKIPVRNAAVCCRRRLRRSHPAAQSHRLRAFTDWAPSLSRASPE